MLLFRVNEILSFHYMHTLINFETLLFIMWFSSTCLTELCSNHKFICWIPNSQWHRMWPVGKKDPEWSKPVKTKLRGKALTQCDILKTLEHTHRGKMTLSHRYKTKRTSTSQEKSLRRNRPWNFHLRLVASRIVRKISV